MLPCMPVVLIPRPLHHYNAGTENVGFSPTRQTSRAPSAKRRDVFGEWLEGWAASYEEPLVMRVPHLVRMSSCCLFYR